MHKFSLCINTINIDDGQTEVAKWLLAGSRIIYVGQFCGCNHQRNKFRSLSLKAGRSKKLTYIWCFNKCIMI